MLKNFIRCCSGFLLIIIITLQLNSCASLSSIYDNDYPLTSRTVKSKTTGLTLRVPQGWREVDNNDDGFIDLWLVNSTNDASIVLTPFNSEAQLNSRVKSDLDVIKDFYLSYINASHKKIIIRQEEVFEHAQNKFEAIEYENSGGYKRDVIFRSGNSYHVLTAYSSGNYSKEELFGIQNSILTSIRYPD